MKEAYIFFRKYYKKDFRVYMYIFFSFAVKVCALAIPYLTKILIDQIEYKNIENFKFTSFILVLTMVVFSIFLSSRYYLQNYIEVKILNELKKEMLTKILRVKTEKLKSISVGELMQKIFNDTEVVRPLVISVFVDCTLNIMYSFSIIIIMFTMNKVLTLILIALMPIFIYFYKVYVPKIEKVNSKIITSEEDIKSLSEEILNGSLDIKINNANEFIEYKISNKFIRYFDLVLNKIKYIIQYDYILVTGIMNFSTLLIYCFGGYLVFKNIISIGTLISFTLYFSRLWDPVEYFMELSKEVKIQLLSLKRIEEYLKFQEEDLMESDKLPEFKELKIENLSFNYGERVIFENLNFEIKSGETIGIKGSNGAGKSTLANIITKLISEYNGNIYYNGLNYKLLNPRRVREKIIFIPSKTFLFSGSITENITLKANSKENMVTGLVEKWEITELIGALVSNNRTLKTRVNNQSNNLSGGEQKIIQILRGIFLEGDVYILDEPFNYVDKKHKQILIELIKEKLKFKTVIIISHDEEIFQCCKKVYKLEKNLNEI